MKRDIIIVLVMLFGFAQNTFAQVNPNVQWQKSYGGSGSENGYSIQKTKDGGYIIAGITNSSDGDVTINRGGSDAWVIKIDATGTIQWERTYGGSNNDGAESIQQTTDGGYIFGGSTSSNDGDVSGNHGGSDAWVVKLDSAGNIQWQKCLGGSGNDGLAGIQQCIDGGYIIGCSTDSKDGDITTTIGTTDVWIVKLNGNGSINWQKSYGSTSANQTDAIYQTPDTGYIIAATVTSGGGDVSVFYGGNADIWILKIDSIGNIQWQKSCGGSGTDMPYSIYQTKDSGYMVAGETNSTDDEVTGLHNPNSGNYDFWIIKTGRLGNLQWQECLGGSEIDEAYSVIQTTDEGYLIAGETQSYDGNVSNFHGNIDCWIVKLDSSDKLQWQSAFGGSGYEEAEDVLQCNDNGYLFVGSTTSTDDDVTFNHGNTDIWVVKLSPSTGVKSVSDNQSFSLFPNPTSEQLTVSSNQLIGGMIDITDLLGRSVLQQNLPANTKQTTLNVSKLTAGIYFVTLYNAGGDVVRKMVKE